MARKNNSARKLEVKPSPKKKEERTVRGIKKIKPLTFHGETWDIG